MKKMVVLFFCCLFFWGCSSPQAPEKADNPAVVVSVSSDGRYVVSSHVNKEIRLWDIDKQTWEIISKQGNPFSAYFLKNSHRFMWQDDRSNRVYVKNLDDDTIFSFPVKFKAYGHVMTPDLKHYFASDVDWGIHMGYGANEKLIKKAAFYHTAEAVKRLSMTLSNDNKYLLTSGFIYVNERKPHSDDPADSLSLNGVVLWDVNTGKLQRKFLGNASKTFSTLSPDGSYVVAGDENWRGYVWKTVTGKRKQALWYLNGGKPIKQNKYGENIAFDTTGLIKHPKDYRQEIGIVTDAILAMKFIDTAGHYLRFTTYIPYTVLYTVDDPRPIKYLSLGKDPWPAVSAYDFDHAIDTAPKAKLLVMGQTQGDGIIVYKFRPGNKTLVKIWVSNKNSDTDPALAYPLNP